MKYFKITDVAIFDSHTLLVEFENKKKKKYDITPLLKEEVFAPLQNSVLFRSVVVDTGGYGIVWNDEIDLSEYELWINGEEA